MLDEKAFDEVTLDFRGHQFQFAPSEYTDDILRGHITADDDRHRLRELEESGNDDWYLNEEGYRFPDDKLFENSPWSIVNTDSRRKVIPRFMDYNTGEASFCLTPWFRIGDEYNQRPA